nr:alpha/beta hydrolase [Allomuricauda sp.]
MKGILNYFILKQPMTGKRKTKLKNYIYIILLTVLHSSCMDNEAMERNYQIIENISVASNITYKKIDSLEIQLDVYYPAIKLGKEPWESLTEQKRPTLIYFHGGGWISGDRTSRFLGLLPYLQKDWAVVNVDYRMLQETDLIGSLNDCIDAINWVYDNALTYKFDTDQIYLSGESAGGHLALLAGLVNKTNLGDVPVQKRKSEIQGIINWYGITHMESAIKFWDDASYEKMILDKWKGDTKQYLDFTSPLNHIASNIKVPILSIHGDKDENVEIEQAISLHNELESHGIKNKLVKIEGKKHGDFSSKELKFIFNEIWNFLEIEN